MANIQNLSVSLTANTRNFTKGMRRAKFLVADFKSVTRTSIGTVAKFGGAIAAAAGIGGLGYMIQQQFAAVDALAKTSDKLGIQIDRLIGLRFAAEQTGNSVQTFDMGIQRMTRRIAEAAQGTGEAQDAIKQLGLDATRLAAMSPDQQFMAIADAMEQVSSQGERVRLGFKLFDSEGVALINTLRGGTDQIEKFLDEANKLGISLSRVEAKQIEQANDAINRMKNAIQGVFRQLAILLAPMVEHIADRFTAMSTKGEGAAGSVGNAFQQVTMSLAKLGDWINFISGIFQTFRFAVLKVFEFLAKGANKFFGIIGKGIEVVTGKNPFKFIESFAEEAGRQAESAFRKAGDSLGEGFTGSLQKRVKQVMEEITAKSKDSAQKAVNDINSTIPTGLIDATDKDVGTFKQIDAARVAFGAQGSVQREQKVRVDQLNRTNEILMQIKGRLGQTAVAA